MKFNNTQKNFIYIVIGQGSGKALTLIYTLMLPRLLGINAYGEFAFFYSICLLIIQPIMELGLDMILVKSVSQGFLEVLSETITLKGVSALVLGGIVVFLTIKLGWPSFIVFNLYAYITLISIQRTCFAYYRGKENMILESLTIPIEKLLCIVLTLTLYFSNFSLDYIAPSSLAMSAFVTTISTFYFCQDLLITDFLKPLLIINLLERFKEGIYLAGVSILGLIYFRVDTIMLGMISNFNEVANYNAAFRLIEGLIFFPSIIMIVYFPKLSKNSENISIYFPKLFKYLTCLGIFLVLIVLLLSDFVINILYGEEWNASVFLLRSLSLSLCPICVGHLVTQSLVAINQQKPYFWMVFFTTLENILLNLILIPKYNAFGASIATFLTELTITCLCLYWLYYRQKVVII